MATAKPAGRDQVGSRPAGRAGTPGPAGSAGRTGKADQPADVQVEEALELLRASGGRVTTSRRLLLHCLFAGGSHRTAEELAAEVQALAPDVHLSTIYRNLEELERLGVVVHAHLGHGAANYHLASDSHGHLVCESCGVTFEASDAFFEALSEAASSSYGFTIDPRHFAVLGRCATCARLQRSGR